MESTGPPSADRNEIEQKLSAMRERMAQRAGAAAAAADALLGLTTSAETDDGAVRATVTATGALRELTLGDAVRTWAPERIAEHVLRCVQQAQAGLADAAHDAIAPAGPELASLVADQLHEGFPQPAPEPGATDVDDDYFAELTFVRPTDEH
ncbi:YbaB/EbfC family nucleoid-associated protein [Amycolatopsis lurida]